MSKIYEYEFDKWRELQSNFTRFLSILNSDNINNIEDKDNFLLKMLELNSLIDKIDVVLDDIKYECIYPNSKKKDHKIKKEISEHLNRKMIIKNLVIGLNI